MKLHKWISAKILNKTRLCVTDKDTEEKEKTRHQTKWHKNAEIRKWNLKLL